MSHELQKWPTAVYYCLTCGSKYKLTGRPNLVCPWDRCPDRGRGMLHPFAGDEEFFAFVRRSRLSGSGRKRRADVRPTTDQLKLARLNMSKGKNAGVIQFVNEDDEIVYLREVPEGCHVALEGCDFTADEESEELEDDDSKDPDDDEVQ